MTNKTNIIIVRRDNKLSYKYMVPQYIQVFGRRMFLGFCEWFDNKSKAKYFIN